MRLIHGYRASLIISWPPGSYWEANFRGKHPGEGEGKDLERFIRRKYEQKEFVGSAPRRERTPERYRQPERCASFALPFFCKAKFSRIRVRLDHRRALRSLGPATSRSVSFCLTLSIFFSRASVWVFSYSQPEPARAPQRAQAPAPQQQQQSFGAFAAAPASQAAPAAVRAPAAVPPPAIQVPEKKVDLLDFSAPGANAF